MTKKKKTPTKQYRNPDRARFDPGPHEFDWAAKFPLGVTPPLAAGVVETWLNNEHARVSMSAAESRLHGSYVTVRAHPPNKQSPWTFSYRCSGLEEHDEWMPPHKSVLITSNPVGDGAGEVLVEGAPKPDSEFLAGCRQMFAPLDEPPCGASES